MIFLPEAQDKCDYRKMDDDDNEDEYGDQKSFV